MTRSRALRTVARGVVALGVGIVLGMAPPSPASAEPSAEEIEAQIDAKWEQLEPVIEQYNKVHSELKTNQKKSAALREKIAPLSLQTNVALNRVGDLASRYYKVGPGSDLNALLNTGSPGTLAEQLFILDRLAKQQNDQIAGLTAVREKYDAQKRKLDTLIAQQKQQDTELAARKKQIDAEIKRLQAALPKTVVKVAKCPTVTGKFSTAAATAIKVACAQVGKPYVWGAAGPNSFDCSGLTQYAYRKAGVSLTHHTGAQWREGEKVSKPLPGDLVFFYSDLHHVGLYLGNGLMVHAPRAGKPVQVAATRHMPLAGYRRPG